MSFPAQITIPILLGKKLRADESDDFKVSNESCFVRDVFGLWKAAICLEELNTALPEGRGVNLITSWASLTSLNYIDGAQTAQLSGPEMKQQFEDIRERRCLKIAMCHSKDQESRLN